MKLMFIGADHEVTGSCHFIEAAGKNILVDYCDRERWIADRVGDGPKKLL